MLNPLVLHMTFADEFVLSRTSRTWHSHPSAEHTVSAAPALGLPLALNLCVPLTDDHPDCDTTQGVTKSPAAHVSQSQIEFHLFSIPSLTVQVGQRCVQLAASVHPGSAAHVGSAVAVWQARLSPFLAELGFAIGDWPTHRKCTADGHDGMSNMTMFACQAGLCNPPALPNLPFSACDMAMRKARRWTALATIRSDHFCIVAGRL